MSLTFPHNCHVGKISVHPANWDRPGASLKEDWYIHYRFHDPGFEKKYPKGYLVKIRGMNDQKSIAERRRVTRDLIEDEKGKLKTGFNPILKKIVTDVQQDYLVHPTTPFIRALEEARNLSKVDRGTKEGMKTVIKYVTAAAISCGLHNIEIKDIRRRHLMKILQVCGEQKKTWTNELYNFYVKYLGMLFKPLVKAEATEVNATNGLDLMKKTERVKAILTLEQRKAVDAYLREISFLSRSPQTRVRAYFFWRFLHVFFHSGSRLTELLKVRGCDVELQNQRFKRTIKKGPTVREKPTTIKDVALPYWHEAMADCRPDQYVFSVGLVPGATSIRPEQVTRRWKLYIKERLGIEVDLYALKHLNSTETVDAAGDQAAADQNGHTSTAMVRKIYDVGRGTREHEKLKKINNPFV